VREDDRRPVARDLTVEDEARPTIHLKRNSLHRTYTLAKRWEPLYQAEKHGLCPQRVPSLCPANP
jgi:hypothetical protein